MINFFLDHCTYVPATNYRAKQGVATVLPLPKNARKKPKPTFDAVDLQQLIPGIPDADFERLFAIVSQERKLYTNWEFAQLMVLFSQRRISEQKKPTNSPCFKVDSHPAR
jgi:hypothetical protein